MSILNEPETTTEDLSFSLGVHLVIFLDLLGQSDELQQLRRIPRTDSELAATRQIITRSAARVRQFRNRLQSMFSGLTSAYSELEQIVPPENRERFKRLQPRINQTGFSDCVVVSIPLQEEPGEQDGSARAAGAIYTVLVALSGITLQGLSLGVPIRGGLQVGTATELFPGEVYGAPLLDAYKLESTIADYPRTVVHPDLFGYLQYLETRQPDSDSNRYVIKKAGECRRLVCEAPDDLQPMLHFLSAEVVRAEPEFAQFRLPAYQWVRSQVGRYRQQANLRLAGRYSRLAKYFDTYATS